MVNKTENYPQRRGYDWVKNPDVAKGGYWRKSRESNILAAVAGSAVVGGVAIGALLHAQKPVAKPGGGGSQLETDLYPYSNAYRGIADKLEKAGLAKDEAEAMVKYLNGHYTKYNNCLANGSLDDALAKEVSAMMRGMDKLPSIDESSVFPVGVKYKYDPETEDEDAIYSHRKLGDHSLNRYSKGHPSVASMKIGDELIEPRFLSTSALQDESLSYPMAHHVRKNIDNLVIYRIKPHPHRSKGKYLGNEKEEAEVLFQAGAKFRVVSKEIVSVELKKQKLTVGQGEKTATVIELEEI
jgi:ADP-ribosyltransferase exoenzyme